MKKERKAALYAFLQKHTKGKLREKFARGYRKYACAPQIIGRNNDIQIFLKGKQVQLQDIGGILHANIVIAGSNNLVVLHADELMEGRASLNLFIEADHNRFLMEEEVRGSWNISLYGNNNRFSVGMKTACGDFSASLHSNEVRIGHHCMISSAEELWTDGHSVIDNESKACLNVPNAPTVIGNHVWLGRRVTLTKGAHIPDDCIVGIGSIVTKAFVEPNCVIAGAPARVVKRGINWDGRRPADYDRDWHAEHSTIAN